MNYRRMRIKEFLYLFGVDAFITNYRPNFMYLSGFTGSTGVLIITRDRDYIIVDGRYILRTQNEVDKDIDIIDTLDKASILKKAVDLLNNLNVKRLGVEQNNMKVGDFLYFSQSFEIKCFNYLVESLRAEKDEEEIKKIKRALEISEMVLKEAEERLYNGIGKITEIELANFIKNRIIELGGSGTAFEPIVAFGKNTAFPHYTPSNTVLQEGDFVIIDMGAVVDYYHSDITRSFCIGKNPEFSRLYNIVLEAQEAAINSIKYGVLSIEPYNVAINIFEKYDLKERFTHGLGHGVGLEIHELPSLSSGGFGFLKVNNVITVEPGVYIPDIGGIRIEDMVLVDINAKTVLTKYKK
ncbi:MAG: Xaa-Pro peptidase family protein [Candidatus Calescibacterium sp.]|nr:Xaa-Pro peptidase family protein [Candidatus Calescibacterium sp.]